MDAQTLLVYESRAAEFCARYRATEPRALYGLIEGFFLRGAPTADVGCGSGRDVAWLSRNGFPCVGYDGSPAMITEARNAYPGIDVRQALLPDLVGVEDGGFANVLCSATIMHLPQEDLIGAVLNLARILAPGGRLILTYRASRTSGEREPDGRLFASIPAGRMTLLLESAGFGDTLHLELPDTESSTRWHTFLARKGPQEHTTALGRIWRVLAYEHKTATYKPALIRALSSIARQQAHLAVWGKQEVFVPLWAVAREWLIYYWPIINALVFTAQLLGETSGSKQLRVRRAIGRLAQRFGQDAGGLYSLLRAMDEEPESLRGELAAIAAAIREGPVRYAGAGSALFGYEREVRGLPPHTRRGEADLGWVVVPQDVWLDLTRFGHWIEQSAVARWAELTARMTSAGPEGLSEAALGTAMRHLLAPDEHAVQETRELLLSSGINIRCVWTGRELGQSFRVDHVIPRTAWRSDDLWNALPRSPDLALPADAVPTGALLSASRERIVYYWSMYSARMPGRFGRQLRRALGTDTSCHGWDKVAFAALREAVERVALTQGLRRWQP